MASKKARVLVATSIDGDQYAANDVASFDEAVIKAHPGVLDASPEAVKYAEGLKKKASDAIEG